MSLPPPVTILPENPTHSDVTNSLSEQERECWQQLKAAIRRKKDPFKTMTVATCTSQGADARMVVLRKIDALRKYVWFHTDARAKKVMQLEAFPMATLLFWDDKRQIQLRLTVETRLHTDDYIADEHWEALWAGGRKVYLSEQVPGSEQPFPYPGFPASLGEDVPSVEETEVGRKNFAVIECRVLAMEFLQLNRSGQTRARFQYEPESGMVWLAP